jgi:hypothetical protein
MPDSKVKSPTGWCRCVGKARKLDYWTLNWLGGSNHTHLDTFKLKTYFGRDSLTENWKVLQNDTDPYAIAGGSAQ